MVLSGDFWRTDLLNFCGNESINIMKHLAFFLLSASAQAAISTAQGQKTSISGTTTIGSESLLPGTHSFVAGYLAEASGTYAIAQGDGTLASGARSFATGLESRADDGVRLINEFEAMLSLLLKNQDTSIENK